MIQYPRDIIPNVLANELLRLSNIDREWAVFLPIEDNDTRFKIDVKPGMQTWIGMALKDGSDVIGMYSISLWLVDGPKIFRPTLDQCRAMENIEVNISTKDYSQPYQAILIDLPRDTYNPFTAVLCCDFGKLVSFSLFSEDHQNDIVTTIKKVDSCMETAINKYDVDCAALSTVSNRVLRIAINSCLALSSYGHCMEYLYPKDVARDQHLVSKEPTTERGIKAKQRVSSAMQLLTFNQDVKLHSEESTGSADHGKATSSGREMSTHWRRGHWAMQAYGPNHSLRKRILRKPVLVRADLFMGELAATSTTYKS